MAGEVIPEKRKKNPSTADTFVNLERWVSQTRKERSVVASFEGGSDANGQTQGGDGAPPGKDHL